MSEGKGLELDYREYLDPEVGSQEIRAEAIAKVTRMRVNLELVRKLNLDLDEIKVKVRIGRDWIHGIDLDFSTLGTLRDGLYYSILKAILHANRIKQIDRELVCEMIKAEMMEITMEVIFAMIRPCDLETKDLAILVDKAIEPIIDSLRIDLFSE